MTILRLESAFHKHCQKYVPQNEKVVIAVSGGADSLAMAHMAQIHFESKAIFATVNHKLREAAAFEAQHVYDIVTSWGGSHKTLVWQRDKGVSSSIQSEARTARYNLLTEFAKQNDAPHIFVAHHGDDQMETLLMRLIGGSGPQGLIGMRPVKTLKDGINLHRPLLKFTHHDLVQHCKNYKLDWVEDPTNQDRGFLRPRLRSLLDHLKDEGWSASRAAETSKRLLRQNEAIEFLTQQALEKTKSKDGFLWNTLKSYPEAIILNCLRAVFADPRNPRLEKVEALMDELLTNSTFKGRTLGGFLFQLDEKKGILKITAEK